MTAREKAGFSFFVAPVSVAGVESFVLITAFYDDERDPLTITSPFLENDPATPFFIDLFRKNEFEVYFFDEQDREWLSFKAACDLSSLVETLQKSAYIEKSHWQEMLHQAASWFALRGPKDDEESFKVKMIESIFTERLTVFDTVASGYDFRGASQFSTTTLDRDEAGSHQEWDIALLMRRVFSSKDVYLSPYKVSDNKELVDVLVVSDEFVYLIQAKDSPNNLQTLHTRIDRKRSRSIAQVKEASKQLQGAITYCERNPNLKLRLQNECLQLDIRGKTIIGIEVIKEVFPDASEEYSKIIFKLMDKVQKNVVLLDYSELAQMTMYCPEEGLFLCAIGKILDAADEHGRLVQVRFSGPPPEPKQH
ncbi:MAG: hypothetical protein ACTJH7_06560 [Alcaligenes sp.]